jgi:5-methylcytosine-specific restriction endonuclease McrA
MAHRDGFWKLEHLSNAQLLQSLGGVLRRQRCALAEVVAHLGEVEERRLHLEAAHSSMFAYCVAHLGMSEDEACRRIDLARLARRFPALFAELANGQITLSVALVLKPVLSPNNQLELLSAVRGKNIRQARELLAERFPQPDAPSSIRKLPERRPAPADLAPGACAPAPASQAGPLLSYVAPSSPASPASAAADPAPPNPEARSAVSRNGSAPRVSQGSIEPLSAGRYRIQFTADAALKQQLELARNLLRHAHPTGDFAPIVSRALKLLIDDLLRQRFGAVKRRKAARPAPTHSPTSAPEPSDPAVSSPATAASARPASAKAAHSPSPAPAKAACSRSSAPESSAPAVPSPATVTSARPAQAAHSLSTAQATSASAVSSRSAVACAAPGSRAPVPRPARRAVFERDGLGCSWLDANGVRCGNQAWLEFDHRHPAGKGGSSEPENLRLLCRSHNGLAAEHAYGRRHIEQAVLRRQKREYPRNSQQGG